MITRDQIALLAPRPSAGSRAENWTAYVDALVAHGAELCAEFGIDQACEWQQFIAQVAHESGGFTILWESMNYLSAARVLEIFGVGHHSAAITPAEAEGLIGNPERLAERVYGLGNPRKARELGNIESGDGFRFRGFGPMQTTGRQDHERLLAGDYSPLSALRAAFREWDEKGCNTLAAKGDLKAITRRINGGYNGLAERAAYLTKARRIWPTFGAAPIIAEIAPTPIEALVPVSRKVRLLEKIKTTLGVGTAGAGGLGLMGQIDTMKGYSDAIRAVMADNVLLIVLAACVVGVGLAFVLQGWIAEDHAAGRYQPSQGGAGDGGA